MNITIITEVLPWPLNTGGAQAQFNMIDYLRHKHHITLIFWENKMNKLESMKILQTMWPEVRLVIYPLWRQLFYPKFLFDKLERALRLKFTPNNTHFKVQRILKPYGIWFSWDYIHFVNNIILKEHTDIIQVEFFACLQIANYLPQHITKIFIHHELRFIRNERQTSVFHLTSEEKKQLQQTKKQEIDDLKKYDAIITLTQQDKDFLKAEGVTTPIRVSPAAVRTSSLPFKCWNGRLSFVGAYIHGPNQEGINWYIEHVLPILSDQTPALDIIGKGWPEKYSLPQIKLKGFVADLPNAIHGSIMIVPILSGSGMRMKIVEAMAMSMAIITTTVGVEGIPLVNKESCLIADKPEDFAAAILYLSSHPHECQRLGQKSNEIFQRHYSIEVLSNLRGKIYNELYINNKI